MYAHGEVPPGVWQSSVISILHYVAYVAGGRDEDYCSWSWRAAAMVAL